MRTGMSKKEAKNDDSDSDESDEGYGEENDQKEEVK